MFQIRNHVYWCECNGRAIFLDAEADRYCGLPDGANAAFLRLAGNASEPGDCARLELLVRRNLLIETADGEPLRAPPWIAPPAGELPAYGGGRVRAGMVLAVLASELRTGRALRTTGFLHVLEAAQALSSKGRSNAVDAVEQARAVAAAAAVLGLVTRSHDRCLVRGLAVHALCRKRGIPATLVLGVTAAPFTAHCWVQLGSAVIVGGYEQARLYTPILVLE